MTKNGQHDDLGDDSASLGLTSLLANSTLGMMCGRQRPSISMMLVSLSAIGDTEKTTGLIKDNTGGLLCVAGLQGYDLGPVTSVSNTYSKGQFMRRRKTKTTTT